MTTSERIHKAKISLILTQPFFASIALQLSYNESSAIETTNVDGLTINYNAAFIDRYNDAEIVGILAHLVLHVVSFHHLRRAGREESRWNQATDYAINPILLNAGFKLPPDYLYEEKYVKKTAEQIYRELPTDDNRASSSAPRIGDVNDLPQQNNAAAHELLLKQEIIRAAQTERTKAAGKVPGFVELLISKALEPKVNWKAELNRFLTQCSPTDYTWKTCNRRYLSRGLYLPSLSQPSIRNLITVLDTSGSIREEQLNAFSAELRDISQEVKSTVLTIYVDTKIQRIQELDPDDNWSLQPIGGGGTDFRPAFQFIEESGDTPAALLYLTDGICYNFPETEPDYPVLWVKFGDYDFEPPFGEVIQID
ncbi:VWA-like domain-containing protein [Paraflavitalea sp. CAU 1676]|uniref:vWA domain-containing protein n=1 Tax=Paraflavitalea sp. CAU 1676 TaxID=3032598 RepID=UPI0023DA6AFC|nr:VWA-like domain-containing protein [Paraflavitalea sp. CAU 1676]MDF2191381.1 VWA-like domain-containing protein [Paraflavitalea sp. CAU 1676]